ncbi:MAG: sigma-70 family RNA polymerase sigma factor [Thomasclavelia sp.]|nr:sigma-70 family RNA polymerase sigma factor [Thomasclavelia sp.]
MENIHIRNQKNITKYLNGNKDAFNDIYEDNYKSVYFMAYNFFNNEEDAKDIVQDVFVKVSKSIDKLENPITFNLWIKKITYNTCLSVARKKHIQVVDLGEEGSIDNYANDNNDYDVDNIVLSSAIEEEISLSLQKLSFPLKSVGILKYYDNLTNKEIAEILGIPIGTVASREHRMSALLTNDLEKKEITPKMLYSVIPSSFIQSAYLLLFSKLNLDSITSDKFITGIIGTTAAVTGISVLAKASIGTIITCMIVGGGVAVKNSQSTAVADTSSGIVEPAPIEFKAPTINATITDVLYDTNYVNHEVDINVQTSNNNYKNMLINGVNTSKISKNGTYTVTLIDDNDQIISSKEINITNIDMDAPDYSYVVSNDSYTFKLSDDLSGVNYNNVKFYIDGVINKNYSTNSSNNTITITCTKEHTYKLLVYDKAGNFNTISIGFESA